MQLLGVIVESDGGRVGRVLAGVGGVWVGPRWLNYLEQAALVLEVNAALVAIAG